jgi:hypothetical protein
LMLWISIEDFTSAYENCMATSNPVLTVRSIDDPFIKAATLTHYTLDFGTPAVSSAFSGMFFLIAGLCWTTATWGLTYQHCKRKKTTAANPLAGGAVAMPMAVANPVDDGIYSQQQQTK